MGKVTATLDVRVENRCVASALPLSPSNRELTPLGADHDRDTGKLIALGAHVKQDVTRPPEVMTRINGHMIGPKKSKL